VGLATAFAAQSRASRLVWRDSSPRPHLNTHAYRSLAPQPFTWDAGAGLPLLLADGAASYVYGPGGQILEQIAGSTPAYYHSDQLGSVRALTDQSGAVVATYAYDAYGQPTRSTGSAPNPFRYAGEYRDGESGLYYLRARYYDPATAQFLTVDPLLAATAQAYAYAAGSPLNATDPRGDCPWCGIIAIGAVGGALGNVAATLIGDAISGRPVSPEQIGNAAISGGIAGAATALSVVMPPVIGVAFQAVAAGLGQAVANLLLPTGVDPDPLTAAIWGGVGAVGTARFVVPELNTAEKFFSWSPVNPDAWWFERGSHLTIFKSAFVGATVGVGTNLQFPCPLGGEPSGPNKSW
jgi:RHS repeat-associated protein